MSLPKVERITRSFEHDRKYVFLANDWLERKNPIKIERSPRDRSTISIEYPHNISNDYKSNYEQISKMLESIINDPTSFKVPSTITLDSDFMRKFGEHTIQNNSCIHRMHISCNRLITNLLERYVERGIFTLKEYGEFVHISRNFEHRIFHSKIVSDDFEKIHRYFNIPCIEFIRNYTEPVCDLFDKIDSLITLLITSQDAFTEHVHPFIESLKIAYIFISSLSLLYRLLLVRARLYYGNPKYHSKPSDAQEYYLLTQFLDAMWKELDFIAIILIKYGIIYCNYNIVEDHEFYGVHSSYYPNIDDDLTKFVFNTLLHKIPCYPLYVSTMNWCKNNNTPTHLRKRILSFNVPRGNRSCMCDTIKDTSSTKMFFKQNCLVQSVIKSVHKFLLHGDRAGGLHIIRFLIDSNETIERFANRFNKLKKELFELKQNTFKDCKNVYANDFMNILTKLVDPNYVHIQTAYGSWIDHLYMINFEILYKKYNNHIRNTRLYYESILE